MTTGSYFMSRVTKENLSPKELKDTIANAPTIARTRFNWTLTDIVDQRTADIPFIFGKMSKYRSNGKTSVIDIANNSQAEQEVPNLLEASSPFIYLPNCSGLAFLPSSNGISDKLFQKMFTQIIKAAYDDGFFMNIEVNHITDYRSFTVKLSSLTKITEISARVTPPNPLFGRLWKELNDYITARNATDIYVEEKGQFRDGLNTDVTSLTKGITEDKEYEPKHAPSLCDAAILMAADGYGQGHIKGYKNQEYVTIKTSDAKQTFNFSRDPNPEELAIYANMMFERVTEERDMQH